ncbi:sulfotransferase domain-containing protein [Radiobacillus sp. PE A8.2]|uniref:sulfotransferase domain-containing protein n=1 Tax=Radiobacillus sp. PE A8.2 TaxID=3380349 RepID=UPI00388FF163
MSKALLPPFLMTSVPKSGTHLLHQILTGMPTVSMDIKNLQKKFFMDNKYVVGQDKAFQDHFQRLKALPNNQFGLGHLWYTANYKQFLKTLNMKHIFLHRDPRDVLVSMSYFIPSLWPEHPLHLPFQTVYTTPKARMMALISGVKWPDFYHYNMPFYEWLIDSETLHISFEELIKSEASRRSALVKIVNFLWADVSMPCSVEEMVNQMVANIDNQTSGTFRKGAIGSWKHEFDEEVKAAFKANAGDMLIRFGYENNNDW